MTVAEAFEQFKSELELPDREQDKAAAAQDYVMGHVEGLRDRAKEVAEVIGRS